MAVDCGFMRKEEGAYYYTPIMLKEVGELWRWRYITSEI